jgi:hypothetical protein
VGGADTARRLKWREGVRVWNQGALTLGPLYPHRCALAERDGFDAVIIHCFIDPGLRAAERLRITIFGPGAVTLKAAAPSSETVDSHWEQVKVDADALEIKSSKATCRM